MVPSGVGVQAGSGSLVGLGLVTRGVITQAAAPVRPRPLILSSVIMVTFGAPSALGRSLSRTFGYDTTVNLGVSELKVHLRMFYDETARFHDDPLPGSVLALLVQVGPVITLDVMGPAENNRI